MEKIVIIDPNEEGGHCNYCHSLSSILANENNEVVYVNREYKTQKKLSYTHIFLGYKEKSKYNKIKSYFNMYLSIKNYSSKNYLLHFQEINFYLMIVILLLRINNSKNLNAFFTLHNLQPHSSSIKEKIHDILVKNIFLSHKMFSKIFYHYGFFLEDKYYEKVNLPSVIREKMFFVPHHLFNSNIYNSKGTLSDNINILIFGVVRENKGILEFFKKLSDNNINVENIKFVVAGFFFDYPEKILKDIIDNSPNNISCTIINHFLSDDEKVDLFMNTDYILLPYKESFLAQSGIVIDAYQYQKPLITSSNIALTYLVEKEGTGYVYNNDNLQILFEKYIFDGYRYSNYLQNINKILKNKYSNKAIYDRYNSYYSSVKI